MAGGAQAGSTDLRTFAVPTGNHLEGGETKKPLTSNVSAFALAPLTQGGKLLPSGGTSLPSGLPEEGEIESGLQEANASLVTASTRDDGIVARSGRSISALEGLVQTTLAKPSAPLGVSPDAPPGNAQSPSERPIRSGHGQTQADSTLRLAQDVRLPALQSNGRDLSSAVATEGRAPDTLTSTTRPRAEPSLEAKPSRPVAPIADEAVKGLGPQLAGLASQVPSVSSAKPSLETSSMVVAEPALAPPVAAKGSAGMRDARPTELSLRSAAAAEAPQPKPGVGGEAKLSKEVAAPARPATAPEAPPPAGVAQVAVKSELANARLPLRADPRIDAKAANLKALSPVQPAGLPQTGDTLEADLARAPQTPAPSLPAPPSAAQQSLQAGVDTAAPQPAAPQAQAITAPTAPQPSAQVPASDPGNAARLAAQLESTIDQLTETRSNLQASKPELTVRHQEFGAITMRLETLGNDLRATLSARDPGFVPAIQSALAERAVAVSGETASSSGQRSAEQSNSQSSNLANSNGQGWHSDGRYGSSTGSGQGTSQPYTGQTENRDEDRSSNPGRTSTTGDGQAGDGELFA